MNALAILILAGLTGGFSWLAMKSESLLNVIAAVCFASSCLNKIGELLATGGQP